MDAAFHYLKAHTHVPEINVEEFDKDCGVGVVVTPEQIKQTVADFLSQQADLKTIRYNFNFSEYMKQIRSKIPFAEGKLLS